MSGIYIHIPFCRQACHYCDFHFSTNLKYVDQLVDALCTEIELRKNYLKQEEIKTLYFGGGTPSLLREAHLEKIFSIINNHFQLADGAEITLEANPEDVSEEILKTWKSLGINRLSIGIQTFNEDKLKFINRVHDVRQARLALELIASGFENYNADLIYAIPHESEMSWKKDLDELLSYSPPHVSLYGLTIEEGTVFGKWESQGKLVEVSESHNADAYQVAIESLAARGYEHYEISNFCQPGLYSKHNTSYWRGIKYLGLGPGAHSYDGSSRSWNVRNNHKYIEAIRNGLPAMTKETLTKEEKQNEYILTRIRNMWGIDLNDFSRSFGTTFHSINEKLINQLISDKLAYVLDNHFILSQKGWFVADEITERLMSEK